jgi:hypothetical protein
MDLELEMATSASADQLWDRWTVLKQARDELGDISSTKGEQWKNAVESGNDSNIVRALWSEYEGMWREYRVLSAWTELVFAAWTFRTEGADSVFLDQIDMTVSGGQR